MGIILPLCWFSLYNSETVKAVTLVFCSILYNFIWDIRAKFSIPNSLQSLDIGQNSKRGVFHGQSLVKENCQNSRTSDNIVLKFTPLTKFEKRYKTTSKKGQCRHAGKLWFFIVIFPIFNQFRVIWKPDSGHLVCKLYTFINNNLLSYENWKQN